MIRYCLLLAFLIGCAHSPFAKKPPEPPPATTQASCVQIRDFFAKHGASSTIPQEMKDGCHMRITVDSHLAGQLSQFLESSGWKRDTTFGKDAVPPRESAWETPSTRCIIEQIQSVGGSSGVHGGIGVSGGTHVSTDFGIGIGIGSSTGGGALDYKIDCLPK